MPLARMFTSNSADIASFHTRRLRLSAVLIVRNAAAFAGGGKDKSRSVCFPPCTHGSSRKNTKQPTFFRPGCFVDNPPFRDALAAAATKRRGMYVAAVEHSSLLGGPLFEKQRVAPTNLSGKKNCAGGMLLGPLLSPQREQACTSVCFLRVAPVECAFGYHLESIYCNPCSCPA